MMEGYVNSSSDSVSSTRGDHWLLAVNARIERAERQQQRQQLLDRLYRTDKVTRW
jgi:hypothetical protein